jgi:hypothetical protein
MSCRVSSKTMLGAAAALALAVAAMAPAQAENGRNGAAALGVLGGIAAGAAIAGAVQQPRYAAPPPPPPVTVYEEEVEPVCRVVIRREYDGYGWRRVRATICD